MKILPLERSSFNEMKMPLNIHREAIALYPSAEAVLDSIVPNYVVGMIYGCLVEAYAKRTQCANDSNAISNRQRAGNHQRSFYYI